jgi:hypothetical protein
MIMKTVLPGLMALAFASLSAEAVLASANRGGQIGHSHHSSSIDNNSQDRSGRSDRSRAENITYALYSGILQRNPDPGGLRNDVNYILNGGNIPDAAFNIAESPEFRQRILFSQSPRQIVEAMYQGLLGRRADEAGMAGWVELVRNGRPGEAASGIVGSEEFRRRYSN